MHGMCKKLPERCIVSVDSLEELVRFSMSRIDFTMHDPTIQKVRRLLAMEQFRNPRIAELTTKHHIDGLQGMFRVIFEKMMEAGLLKKDDAALLALEYVAPVSLLIHTYDRQPDREQEIMERIEIHLRHFVNVYGV